MLAEEVGAVPGFATLLCACCGIATLHQHNVCLRCKTLVVFPSMRTGFGTIKLSKTARRVFGKSVSKRRGPTHSRWSPERDAALIAGYQAARKAKTFRELAAHLSAIAGPGTIEISDLYKRASRIGIT
jgi:hypothetical protein